MLDEPTSHLDLKYQIELLRYLKSWVMDNNKILIAVFHDLNLARHFGDTAILIDNGNLAASGTIEEILNNKILESIYGMDVRALMLDSLEKWKQ